MTDPKPGRDDGFPEHGDLPCGHRLPAGGGWCTKSPHHTGACEGTPIHPIDTNTIDFAKRR